jgi:hypothetical protein
MARSSSSGFELMGIRDQPISLRSPWPNGYSERLIGSIRRDCLDHVVVFGRRHLHQSAQFLRKILQRGSYAPIAAQGRANSARRSDGRSHAGDASSGRTAPPIFPSVSLRQAQGVFCGLFPRRSRRVCPLRRPKRDICELISKQLPEPRFRVAPSADAPFLDIMTVQDASRDPARWHQTAVV